MFEFSIKQLYFVVYFVSPCATFQSRASNQITLSSRVLDQLAKAKATRKRRRTRRRRRRREEGGYVFQSSDQLLQV